MYDDQSNNKDAFYNRKEKLPSSFKDSKKLTLAIADKIYQVMITSELNLYLEEIKYFIEVSKA